VLFRSILIPFKGIPIIPGITEIRPASAVPVAFGLLFGPAGAWGSAIGNLIGDFFGGTLSLGSIFGFFGNFLFAFTMYKAWGRTPLLSTGPAVGAATPRQIGEVALLAVLSSAACGLVIAWGLDLLRLLPFAALGPIIFLNNALTGAVLGPVLVRLLQPRVAAWHLLWTDIMEPEDISRGPRPGLGLALLWIGAAGGLVLGLALSLGAGGRAFQFGVGAPSAGVALGVIPFLIVYLLGALLA
jgi:energy-coupling factor transport system substrate-specific component